MALNAALSGLFRDYASNHRNATNERLHKIAIPLIVFHIVAMLDWVPLLAVPGVARPITLAHLAYLAVVGWYAWLDVRLGLWMAVLVALCFPLGWVTPRPIVIIVAVGAWAVQLAGHVVWEKRRPAFLHNLLHALVGPLYFVAIALGRWPEDRPT